MVTHVKAATTVWPASGNPNKTDIRTFHGETDAAVDALAAPFTILGSSLVDVSGLVQGTGVLATDAAVAAANATIINNALTTSASTGKPVVLPRFDIPITRITPPTTGGFILEMPLGSRLRPTAANASGFFRSATPTTAMDRVRIFGYRVHPYTDVATTYPFAGNPLVAYFSDSTIYDVDVTYAGDQAAVLRLDETLIDGFRLWTDEASGGAGGIRVNGGTNSIIQSVRGQSGDDFVMLNVGDSGVFANTGINNCGYRDVFGTSLLARLMIAYASSSTTSGSVINSFFHNVRGYGTAKGAYISSENSAVQIRRISCKDITILDNLNTSTEAVYIEGNVAFVEFEGTIISPVKGLARVNKTATDTPADIQLTLRNNQAPSTGGQPGINVVEGTRVQITPFIVAPTGQAGVNIAAGDRSTVVGGRISGIDTYGVQATGTATNIDVESVMFQGTAGNSVHLGATSAATARVFNCDLNGRTTSGTAPSVSTNNRA